MGIYQNAFKTPPHALYEKMFTTTTTTTATSMVSSIASSTHSKARSKIVVRAEPTKPKLKKAEEFTVGGGGARGYCDSEEIKDAMNECEGLDGKKLEACYAQYGCDINVVTDHYARVARLEKKSG